MPIGENLSSYIDDFVKKSFSFGLNSGACGVFFSICYDETLLNSAI